MSHPLYPVVGDLADEDNYYTDEENRLRCKAMKCPLCGADLWIKTKGKDFFENVCPQGHFHYILVEGGSSDEP